MKRLKKVLKWTAIVVVGIVAILLIINAVLVSTTSSRLEKQIAAIREAGDPVCLADLARDPIPAEEDAAVFLQRARDGIEAIDRELADVYQSEGYDEGLLKEEEFSAIQAAFEAYPDVIPLLQQAGACPDYNPSSDYTVDSDQFLSDLLPRIQDSRRGVRVLWARVVLLLSRGERQEALQTCLIMLRLDGHYQREPVLIGYLVSLACRGVALDATNRVLRSGQLLEQDRRVLDAELALADDLEGLKRVLKGERTFGLDRFRAEHGREFWFFARAFWNREESGYLDLIEQYLAVNHRPYGEVMASLDAYEAKGGVPHVMAKLSLPALRMERWATERSRAQLRCVRVLNALQGYIEEHEGAEPKLSDLGLPPDVTTDPFSGKPLTMKKLPEGWLIYSVGKNLKDDGGSLEDEQDVGFGPLGPAEND